MTVFLNARLDNSSLQADHFFDSAFNFQAFGKKSFSKSASQKVKSDNSPSGFERVAVFCAPTQTQASKLQSALERTIGTSFSIGLNYDNWEVVGRIPRSIFGPSDSLRNDLSQLAAQYNCQLKELP